MSTPPFRPGEDQLADYYLMQGERWEATLLYSQVDKAFKEDALGHEARFRNAKLSYYTGDFQWAQAQFDILKGSTSKLIANDASTCPYSLWITWGWTHRRGPALYADAELLVFKTALMMLSTNWTAAGALSGTLPER